MESISENENRCIMCGAIIPEGIQVCHDCKTSVNEIEQDTKSGRINIADAIKKYARIKRQKRKRRKENDKN